ncbi:hypothetical protein [Streptomyces sp. NPDC101455]|uniref:hypothetical protein n=1 Tax=Streptomyces sp. NPDC101455 TaxID=3366142 RepID=UPI0038002DBE
MGCHPPREPLPAVTAAVKALLGQSDPARAAVAALIAFHGLCTRQVRNPQRVDVSAGWLHIDDRRIPLAPPVREHVAAYLDHRTAAWPDTADPQLFINRRSDMETRNVGIRWIRLLLGLGPGPGPGPGHGLCLGVSCRSIREDRIRAGAMASWGDARRLHDVFGLSTNAGLRYTAAVDHPGFADATPAQ